MEERKLPFSRIRIPRDDPRHNSAAHHDTHVLARTEPQFPAEATARGIEGDVELDMVIDREGNVMNLSPRTGDPLLTEATIKAVRTWRYRPTKLNGIPVEVMVDVRYRVRLPNTVSSY